MNEPVLLDVRQHIREKYTGIFTPEHMERHYRDYVGFELAEDQLRQVRDLTGIKSGESLLDIGCGYGSFVLVCLKNDIDALGIDIGEFDIRFARQRFETENHGRAGDEIFHLGDGQDTGFQDALFDVITAWNLLEHVPDYGKLIHEAYRLLRPGGHFIGIAPNYLAFRQEAHYHVSWLPLFPRRLAHNYLVNRGLNPSFFDNDIHYVTAWGIHKTLKDSGFKVNYPEKAKFDHPELIHSELLRARVTKLRSVGLLGLLRMFYRIQYWNPLKPTIYFCAYKPYKT